MNSPVKDNSIQRLERVFLWLNNGCNSRCRTCDIWQDKSGETASLDDILIWLPQPETLSLQKIVICGEPLLHPQLWEICQAIRDRGLLIELLTNGYLMSRHATQIVQHCDVVRVSLDGPEEIHIIVLDNGRTRILADEEFREMLCCVRCAACLNVCPVYGKIGGHSYGFPYCGPMGAVLTPLLVGVNRAKDLCLGETLCGACKQACPVDIDIPRMLLGLRAKLAEGDPGWNVSQNNRSEKVMYKVWSWLIGSRRLYDLSLWLIGILQKFLPKKDGMICWLPFPFNGWTMSRDMKPIAEKSFIQGRRKKFITKV